MVGTLEQRRAAIRSLLDTPFVLYFWWLLYDKTTIANAFENSTTILKRRDWENEIMNLMCDKTELTPDYYLSIIRTKIPKLVPETIFVTKIKNPYRVNWDTLLKFQTGVEAGKWDFSLMDFTVDKKWMGTFTDLRVKDRSSFIAFCQKGIHYIENSFSDAKIEMGVPDFSVEVIRIIKQTETVPFTPTADQLTDPYSIYNPANAGKTQAELDAKKLADQQAAAELLAQQQAAADAAAKKKTLLMGGGILAAVLALVAIKK